MRRCWSEVRRCLPLLQELLAHASAWSGAPADACMQEQARSLAAMQRACTDLRRQGEEIKSHHEEELQSMFKESTKAIRQLETSARGQIDSQQRCIRRKDKRIQDQVAQIQLYKGQTLSFSSLACAAPPPASSGSPTTAVCSFSLQIASARAASAWRKCGDDSSR
jgi:hypothetical protein